MHIKPNRVLPIFIRNGIGIFFILSIVLFTVYFNFENIIVPKNADEEMYSNVSNNFTVEHIKYLYSNTLELKPLTFLTLQKILDSSNYVYTRALSFILIFIVTILIYKMTNNKLAFLYVFIPIFLDAMWLTVEIIEVLFILLMIQYKNKSGIFVGILTIFRPTAILYSVFLNKKQFLYVLGIGAAFALLLLYLGLFFPYLHDVTSYPETTFGTRADPIIILYFIMLLIMGISNKKMRPYVVVSAIPLLMKAFWHYFLPVYTFLFIAYLLNMNDDIEEIK